MLTVFNLITVIYLNHIDYDTGSESTSIQLEIELMTLLVGLGLVLKIVEKTKITRIKDKKI